MRTVRLKFSIPAELATDLRREALRQNVTIFELIRRLLKEHRRTCLTEGLGDV